MSEKGKACELDAFFDAFKADAPQPDADFLDRMDMLALSEMPVQSEDLPILNTIQSHSAGRTILERVLDMLGGWTGAGGLASACALGVVIGLNATSGVAGISDVDTANYSTYGIGLLEEFETALLLE